MIYTRFTGLTVSDGMKIQLPAAGVTLFVGPNNAGKSQALRDLFGLVGQPQSHIGRAVTAVDFDKRGTEDDFRAWVKANLPATRDTTGQYSYLVGSYGQTPLPPALNFWAQPLLANVANLFVYHADATSRLTAANSVGNINFGTDAISHPLQRAFIDSELEHELRRASQTAFGVEVVLDRYAGSVIALRVGKFPEFLHDNGVPATSYLNELRELPLLEQQGDGMRSYMGLLLHILGGAHQVTLVDEPEAFLHPPQARLLGRTLGQRSRDEQQVFLATHSVDVVQGVLDADTATTIVRLTRDGAVNRASVLDPEQVKQLWSDPLLRYSNLLDGLFHDAVVLCESDADCRYYGSVFDALYPDEEAAAGQRKPQLLFSHCGGKARLPSVVSSLVAISIPVVVVADFDVLNDADLVERLVTALGGDFEPVRQPLAIVAAALTADSKPASKTGLREALDRKFAQLRDEALSKRDVEGLRSVLRIESGWDKAKRAGVSAVPQGPAHAACIDLLAQLVLAGLLVVPVGELERFVPAVAGHGPAWVTEVLKGKLHEDATNEPPRTFVRKVVTATGRT